MKKRNQRIQPHRSYRYDRCLVIRPQNSMPVRPFALNRYDTNKGESMTPIRPVTKGNRWNEQFQQEQAPPVFPPIAGMLLAPDPHPDNILIVAKMIMPPPGPGRQATPRPLAFGKAAILLPFRRPGIGIVFLMAMAALPLAQSFRLSHLAPSFPLEGYKRNQCLSS